MMWTRQSHKLNLTPPGNVDMAISQARKTKDWTAPCKQETGFHGDDIDMTIYQARYTWYETPHGDNEDSAIFQAIGSKGLNPSRIMWTWQYLKTGRQGRRGKMIYQAGKKNQVFKILIN